MFDSNLLGGGESYNNTLWNDITRDGGQNLTTAFGSSTIGDVRITEAPGGVSDGVTAQSTPGSYTFDGNQAYGAYGSFGGGEDDLWSLTFNDLGVGTFEIILYMGHSRNNRNFSMDVDGTGLVGFTDQVSDAAGVSQISDLGGLSFGSNGGVHFTYNITVTTTDALDDLTLKFGSVSGSSGGGILSGYTVAVVPEPSAFALIAGMFGLTWVMLRRR